MDDLLPCDTAYTAWLNSLTRFRVLRATRPQFKGWELALYRRARPTRVRRKSTYEPTETELRIAMADIRSKQQLKVS